jgi:hypothetical protein
MKRAPLIRRSSIACAILAAVTVACVTRRSPAPNPAAVVPTPLTEPHSLADSARQAVDSFVFWWRGEWAASVSGINADGKPKNPAVKGGGHPAANGGARPFLQRASSTRASSPPGANSVRSGLPRCWCSGGDTRVACNSRPPTTNARGSTPTSSRRDSPPSDRVARICCASSAAPSRRFPRTIGSPARPSAFSSIRATHRPPSRARIRVRRRHGGVRPFRHMGGRLPTV